VDGRILGDEHDGGAYGDPGTGGDAPPLFDLEAGGGRTTLPIDGETLGAADFVRQGDVLETGPNGAVGVRLADDTTLSLDKDARMVLDEFVFNPDTASGAMVLSLVRGALVFVSGEIAGFGENAMSVQMPTAVVGIRGTKVGMFLNALEELLVKLFTPESVLSIVNDVGQFLMTGGDDVFFISSATTLPEVPENADELVEDFFSNAERFLPPSHHEDESERTENEGETTAGRLAQVENALLTVVNGGVVLPTNVIDQVENQATPETSQTTTVIESPLDETGGPPEPSKTTAPTNEEQTQTPVNTAPNAADNTYAATEDVALNIPVGTGVLNNGGDGFDQIDFRFSDAVQGVVVNLSGASIDVDRDGNGVDDTFGVAAGTALDGTDFGGGGEGVDTIIDIEGVRATDFRDVIVGGAVDETFLLFGGDDEVVVGLGNKRSEVFADPAEPIEAARAVGRRLPELRNTDYKLTTVRPKVVWGEGDRPYPTYWR
jgi:hypothetical protein